MEKMPTPEAFGGQFKKEENLVVEALKGTARKVGDIVTAITETVGI